MSEPAYTERAIAKGVDPGLMDQLEEGINRLSGELERLEARTSYVRLQRPESEVATPEPAPENALHGEIIRLNRYISRMSAIIDEIRL